ncbi:MAG TPA: energy transducer TonB [Vicinamibacterales bacterium]|nr:energy transducer TonB [Vicinamibacterales bacterium]
MTLLPKRRRKTGASLVLSGLLHGAMLALLLTLASLGLLNSVDTEQIVVNPTPIRLVFLTTLGPGGGGGGGGLKMPAPPPPAERKAPPKPKLKSPVPPVKKVATPPPVVTPRPTPTPTPVVTPPVVIPRVETPPPTATPEPPRFMPPQAIQAPVVPQPADKVDTAGTLGPSTSSAPSNGPGTGGGVGSGSGAGIGEGRGGGIGPGSGGGTGGGPYQPGSGVAPPVLLKEVRPGYTDEARRRSIEGDVLLEIVVKQDGSVGNVRVTRSLGAGLEQKAIDAVRQWRFGPARRQGQPVDVVVEVSVEFKLR